MTSAVQASFASIPDKSRLTQLVQPGHNMVNKDVTAMDIDIPMDKQVRIILLYIIILFSSNICFYI